MIVIGIQVEANFQFSVDVDALVLLQFFRFGKNYTLSGERFSFCPDEGNLGYISMRIDVECNRISVFIEKFGR